MSIYSGFILFESIIVLLIFSTLGFFLIEQQTAALLETHLAMQNEKIITELSSQSINTEEAGAISIPVSVHSRWHSWKCETPAGSCVSLWRADETIPGI
jgi:hypothetical protein